MTYYVSITGLQTKSPIHLPMFWWHALLSMSQAKKAAGNISAEARVINGVRHTLTVWESERDMRQFLYRGAHRNAIKAFPHIATGKTLGYSTSEVPSWPEVHRIWVERGKTYQNR